MNRADKRRQQKMAAKAASRRPPDARAFEAGAEHFQAGRFQKAADAFALVVKAQPDNIDALNNLGISLLRAGNPNAALQPFQKMAALSLKSADAQFNLGTAYDEIGLYPDAETAYREAIASAPDHVMAYSNLAGVYMEMSRQTDAITCYDQVIARAPDFPGVYFAKGVALQELENFIAAIDNYCTARDAPGADDRTKAGALANIGFCHKQLDQLDDAAAAYAEAVSLAPHDASILANLGDTYLKLGECDAALAIADDFLAAHPGDITMLAFKAAALNEAGGSTGLAHLSDFDRIVQPMQIDAPNGYTDMTTFNAALSDFVLNHPTLIMAPASYSTMNGRHTSELMTMPEGPMRDFVRVIGAAVDRYRKTVPVDPGHPWLAQRPDKTKLVGWSVVMDSQGHQLSHIHPSGWLSGVYYPKLPDVIADDDPAHEGWIEFGRTTDHYFGSQAPEVHLIKPREGLMVLFPSYFYHCTIPFTSDQHRISIAFDVVPVL